MNAVPSGLAPELTELFDAEMSPVLRRLGERGRGPAAVADPADAEVCDAVWQGLADGDGLRLGLPAPEHPGRLREVLPLAELMGEALYQSPYFDTLLAADVVAGLFPAHLVRPLLAEVADGRCRFAVATCPPEGRQRSRPGPGRLGERVSAERWYVEAADAVELLLVVADPGVTDPAVTDPDRAGDASLHFAVVPVDQPGVRLRRHDEIGRGELFAVSLTEARRWPPTGDNGPAPRPAGSGSVPGGSLSCGSVPGGSGNAALWASALHRAELRHAGYLLGLARGAVALAVGYAQQRRVFGQPLSKLQAPMFELASLAARLEAIRSLVYQAAGAADTGTDPALDAARCLLLAGELALDAGSHALHLHGAQGLREESDAQLYYRRAVVEALRYGTPGPLRERAGRLLRVAAEER